MFVVDFLSAFLLAVAFTIVFHAILRAKGYGSWREMPGVMWILTGASWVIGMLLVAFCGVASHWSLFLIGALSIGFSGLIVVLSARVQRAVSSRDDLAANVRPAIALYFCMTVLLFFCAVSVRFYIANLG